MTRDSWLWTLSILGALLAYLFSAEVPTLWTYHQWIQFAAFVVATIAGKLSSSPLPGARE